MPPLQKNAKRVEIYKHQFFALSEGRSEVLDYYTPFLPLKLGGIFLIGEGFFT